MSYVIKAVARPLEGKASVRVVGEYEDYDTAVRQRRAMDERCRVARGIILDYADIEFPVVRFTVEDGEINNESDKKPTVEEIATAMYTARSGKDYVTRTVDVYKEIAEFIRDHSEEKLMESYVDYLDFYVDRMYAYYNINDFIDSYIRYHVASNTSPIDAVREAVCNLEKSIEDKKRKLLSNGEIIELV